MLIDLYELDAMRLRTPENPVIIRRLRTPTLHRLLAATGERSAGGIAIASELRRREAWSGPVGWAIWISVGAALVALGSLIVSIARS